MTDFPAAHSMDTMWFAIDRDGHVAVFDTGEAGCVPGDAYIGEDFGPAVDAVRALQKTGAAHDIEGLRVMQAQPHAEWTEFDSGYAKVIAVVRDREAVGDLRERLQAEDVVSTSGTCIGLRPKDVAAFTAFHELGACIECFKIYTFDETDLAEHGVYRYEHTCDNWISGPYAREASPVRPIVEVPLAIREHAVRFEGCFADTPKLQPAEVWKCESWEAAWLASDGKTVRPFEGRGKDYAEQIEQLREAMPELGLEFADAPDDQPDDAPRAPKRAWWRFWKKS